jgi:hypothetical protein
MTVKSIQGYTRGGMFQWQEFVEINEGRASLPTRSAKRKQGKRVFSSYEDEVHENGAFRQVAIRFKSLANVSPTVVFFIATQKTKATRNTISVYSTKPCPLLSARRALRTLLCRLCFLLADANVWFSTFTPCCKGNRRATTKMS